MLATAAGVSVVVFLVLVTLVWCATRLQKVSDTTSRDYEEMTATHAIEAELLSSRHLTDLYIVTREPQLAAERVEAERRIYRLLRRARASATGTVEIGLLGDASDALDEYFATRRRVEERGAGLGAIVAETRPPLDRALRDLNSVQDLQVTSVRERLRANRRIASIAEGAAAAAGAALVLGLATVAFLAGRLFSRPLRELDSAIQEFRRGRTEARAPIAGVRDLTHVSYAFNAMADTLARQRRSQLEFLAGVVHDLRNPLGALKLALDALRKESTTAARARIFSLVDRQIDHLSRMVRDILDASSIEAGKLELAPERFDLRRSAREVVELFAPTSEIHDIVLEIPDEPVELFADPVRVEQVLENLLSNAIKYSPSGGRITVRVNHEPDGVILEVEDQGVGIPPEAFPDLFAPFRRRAPETVAGAGLGLSVVRRIVEAHDGTIDVQSAPGEGSVFRVLFPPAPPKSNEETTEPSDLT